MQSDGLVSFLILEVFLLYIVARGPMTTDILPADLQFICIFFAIFNHATYL